MRVKKVGGKFFFNILRKIAKSNRKPTAKLKFASHACNAIGKNATGKLAESGCKKLFYTTNLRNVRIGCHIPVQIATSLKLYIISITTITSY
jgi:hypothetical protein